MQTSTLHERRPSGLVGPIILIGAGVVLLLNNLGILSWDIWNTLWRLWPVALIAAGLDLLIGRRSSLLSLLIGLLTIGALVAAVLYMGGSPTAAAARQELSYPLDDVSSAAVQLKPGVAELQVGALSGSAELLAGTVETMRGERLEREYGVQSGVAELSLRSSNGFEPTIGDQHAVWDLRLSRSVPLDLVVESGVGRAVLDLSELQVRSLEVSGGVGELDVTLPARGEAQARIDSGVGATVVRIPAGTAARIEAEMGLGGVTVDDRFVQRGDVYVTDDYESNPNRVTLQISGGVGEIKVISVAP